MTNRIANLFLVMLVAGCASCASSKRLTRISPFGEMPPKAELDRDRINTWPLLYHQQGSTSVLWPIVDIDKRGFAVRPVFNKEDHDVSVLFPLSSVNTERGVGWFLTGYKYEKYFGIFPLFHQGDDIDSIGPFWKESKDAFGVFPLAGKFSDTAHVGPLWWHRDGDALEEFGLFPLVYVGDDRERCWVWPLYSHDLRGQARERSFLLSLASFETNENGDHAKMVHPLWYDIKEGEDHTRAFLPFYYESHQGDREVWLTPLYGRGTRDGEPVMTSVLGPLYLDQQDGESRDLFIAALAHRGTRADGAMWRLWPLASYAHGDVDPGPLYSLTLAGYRDMNARIEWNVTPLIHYAHEENDLSWGVVPVVGAERRPDYRKLSLLCSLLYKQESRFSEGERTSVRRTITPFIGSYTSDARQSWRVSPLISAEKSPHRRSFSLLWSMLYKQRAYFEEGEHKRTRASGLFGAVRHDWDEEYARTSVLKYLYRRERRGETVARDIFPFISWDSAPDEGKVSLLWRLLSIERKGDKRGGHILFVPWGERFER